MGQCTKELTVIKGGSRGASSNVTDVVHVIHWLLAMYCAMTGKIVEQRL